MKTVFAVLAFCFAVCSVASLSAQSYDAIIRNGTIYDGSGTTPIAADLAIAGDTIAAIGDLKNASAKIELDAEGLAVAPGFINMLSWATDSLITDGRSLGDIMQGVTLEVFGEGMSYGPLNEKMKRNMKDGQGDEKFDIDWTTLGEYLEFLEKRGVSTNVASFVGATTVRIYVLGYEDRAPSEKELDQMRALVRQAMEEGAMGVGSSLIYPPAFFAKTDELVELCKVAAEYDGMYITHMRSEGARLLEAIDEVLTIARESGIRAEIYHLKQAGEPNWDKLDAVIEKIEKARAEGLHITADMYTYTAGATGISTCLPPWMQEGGHNELVKRLKDPKIRAQMHEILPKPTTEWENMYHLAGPDKTLLVEFKTEKLKPLIGKTLAEAAKERGEHPIDALMNMIIEDDTRVGVVYFMMSEENVRRQVQIPWVSFGSDAGSMAPEGAFIKSSTHPRAYGNFARLLGKYVRDEKLIPLEEAIRKLTTLPASNLKIEKRGKLAKGYFADVVIFDPEKIQDHATFEKPHQLATGMVHVFVNGEQVVKDGVHTGAKPGRVVRGPGWKPAGQ